jgi:hypothetical protein
MAVPPYSALAAVHCAHDVVVARAAAQVAFQVRADGGGVGAGVFLHQRGGAHHHAGRAEAALQAVAFAEGFLHRVQRAGSGEALNGGHGGAVGLDREDIARLDRPAIQVDRAGAALRGVAADVGAGQAQLFAQELDQEGVGFYLRVNGLAVDRQADRNRHACLHVGWTRMTNCPKSRTNCVGLATTRYCRLRRL